MNTTYELKGKKDVSLNGVTIPAHLLGDDGINTTITETTMEIATQGGTFTVGTGTYEEAKVTFSVVLPDMDYYKNIFPDLHETSSHGRGRVALGSSECVAKETTPIVVHYSCQENSDNDVYIPKAEIIVSHELAQGTDAVKVEITANALPSDIAGHNGALMFIGTGDLATKTLWDPVTEEYLPISS